jgi:PAS domain-containing protein
VSDNALVAPKASLADLEYIRIAADSSNELITIAAWEGGPPENVRFLYANEGCARLFGYSVDEIVGNFVRTRIACAKLAMPRSDP